MADPTLSLEQKTQLVRWFTDGYTDEQIVRAVNRLHRDAVQTDDGFSWPQLTRAQVAYARTAHDQTGDLALSGGEVARMTMLGQKQTLLRRLAKHTGDMDEVMDALTEAMRQIEASGALTGSYPVEEAPDVIDGFLSAVDGERTDLHPATQSRRRRGEPRFLAENPLLQQYLALAAMHTRYAEKYTKAIEVAGRIAGLTGTIAPHDATSPSAPERTAALRRTLDELVAARRRPAE
jgi:hypothetical protein